MKENIPVAFQIAILAIQIGVILFSARIFGALAQKLRVPSVLGELIAGIVIGPYVLGTIGIPIHGFEKGIFPLPEGGGSPVSLPLYSLSTIGSIILLFMSGLETDLRMFFRYSVVGTFVGLGGVIFSFAFGDLLGIWMFNTGVMDPRCLFLGILCTATSVGITARILSDHKSVDSPEGTTILAAAVIDDVLGIICLAIVMGIVGASGVSGGSIAWGKIGFIALKSVGIWLGITAIGLLLAHRIAKLLKWFPPSGTFSILAFGLALLLAGFFEQVGLAMIVGAYVMGLCLSKTDIAFTIQRHLSGIYGFLVPIFFVVMGMMVNVRVFGDVQVLKFGLIYAGLAVIAKILGCAIPALCMNFNMMGALRIGMGMIPRGEVALIIAGIGSTTLMLVNGKQEPIIDSRMFGVAIIMTLITTIVAPPLLSFVLGIKAKGVRNDVKDKKTVRTGYDLPSDTVRDFVTWNMVDNFSHEGFRYSALDRDGGITHFRRENESFTLYRTGNHFEFESGEKEAMLIRTVMYETFVELQRMMASLKKIAAPANFHNVIQGAVFPEPHEGKNSALWFDSVVPSKAIIADLKAETKDDAIREMVKCLADGGFLRDPILCEKDVFDRESVHSTTLPEGVALPHARTDGIGRLAAVIGISRKGCLSNPETGERSCIFVLSLCPRTGVEPYLQFVAHIARILAVPENLSALRTAKDAAAVHHVFTGE